MIRQAIQDDLPEIMGLYEASRAYMRRIGNAVQWTNGYPAQSIIERDIQLGKMYCVLNDQEVHGVFFWSVESDEFYSEIFDGAWYDDSPYGVIHRLAGDGVIKDLGSIVIKWCLDQYSHIRIDTHESNKPMLKIMRDLDFDYCGIVYVADGTPRLAFEFY